MAEHRLAVVLPALNEAVSIGACVSGFLGSGACCVFVVDGGSGDRTQLAAATAGARVVSEPRRGYGRACLTGAEHAAGHELICFADADGSCDPGDLGRLIAAVAGADLVLGRRHRPDPASLPWHARLGNRVVSSYLSWRSGRRVRDLPPLKLIRRQALESLALDEEGYGWTVQLVARALARPDLRISEVDVSFRVRAGGESKVSGRLGPSIRAGSAMLAEAERASRRRGLVLLMAKAPREGHSKTRLAEELGAATATAFWTACLADTGRAVRAHARAAGLDAVAVIPAEADRGPVQTLTGLRCVVQDAAGLGAALRFGFQEAAARGLPYAVAVSADSPTLPADRISKAASALRAGRAVLGPTGDGGYYLIGLPLPATEGILDRLFQATPMGGSDVLARTLAAIPGAVVLEPWTDVDTSAELMELAAELTASPAAAPATAAWLQGQAGASAGGTTPEESSRP